MSNNGKAPAPRIDFSSAAGGAGVAAAGGGADGMALKGTTVTMVATPGAECGSGIRAGDAVTMHDYKPSRTDGNPYHIQKGSMGAFCARNQFRAPGEESGGAAAAAADQTALRLDKSLNADSSGLELSAGGCTVTTPSSSHNCIFGAAVFEHGVHSWVVTLRDTKSDPGYCGLGVGDAGCKGPVWSLKPQYAACYTQRSPDRAPLGECRYRYGLVQTSSDPTIWGKGITEALWPKATHPYTYTPHHHPTRPRLRRHAAASSRLRAPLLSARSGKQAQHVRGAAVPRNGRHGGAHTGVRRGAAWGGLRAADHRTQAAGAIA